MSRCTIQLLALAAVAALLVADASAGGKGKIKPATTPDETITNIQAAAQAGDVEGLLLQLGGPAHALMELDIRISLAREAFEDAVEAKFGKDPKAPPRRRYVDEMKDMPKMQVISKLHLGVEKAVLTVWLTDKQTFRDLEGKVVSEKETVSEHKWNAVKEKGYWKLLANFAGGKRVEAKRKGRDGKEITVEVVTPVPEEEKKQAELIAWGKTALPKALELHDKLIKQVKAGDFKNRDAAYRAYNRASEDFYYDYPPPGAKTDDKEVRAPR